MFVQSKPLQSVQDKSSLDHHSLAHPITAAGYRETGLGGVADSEFGVASFDCGIWVACTVVVSAEGQLLD